jgi:hypothetical protein
LGLRLRLVRLVLLMYRDSVTIHRARTSKRVCNIAVKIGIAGVATSHTNVICLELVLARVAAHDECKAHNTGRVPYCNGFIYFWVKGLGPSLPVMVARDGWCFLTLI